MQLPINEQDAREMIQQGHQIQVMMGTLGYTKVFKTILDGMLHDADKGCHNFKLREDRGKYAVIRYNTIEEILSICDTYIENMEGAIQYLKEEGINF